MTVVPRAAVLRANKVEGWFRPLEDGRLEVLLKTAKFRVRCSGTEEQVNRVADLFEEITGTLVNGPDSDVFTRRRSGPKPIMGQMNLTDVMPDEDEFSTTAWSPGLGGD